MTSFSHSFMFVLVIDCDFDNDFCIYSNVNTSDTFDWLRHKGTTSTPGTGPSGDHTSGKGKSRHLLLCLTPHVVDHAVDEMLYTRYME